MQKKIAKIIVSVDEEKRDALKEYCGSQTEKVSMNSLVNGLIDKFMNSKKFETKPKKAVKKAPKKKAEPKKTKVSKKVKKPTKKKKTTTKKKK